jgi:hypothetical protein
MWFFLLKVVIAGLIVALVSLLGQKFPVWGGILAALPIISVLSLSFLYYETGGDVEKVARLSFSTGWFVLSAGLFLFLLPVLLKRGAPFIQALAICFVALIVVDSILVYLLGRVND